MMNNITMYHYLFIGLFMFLTGFFGSVFAKNIIKVLISIEFMLLGININFVTFGTYCDGLDFEGYIMSLFYIGIGAVEFAVALYLFYLMFQKKDSDNIQKYTDL